MFGKRTARVARSIAGLKYCRHKKFYLVQNRDNVSVQFNLESTYSRQNDLVSLPPREGFAMHSFVGLASKSYIPFLDETFLRYPFNSQSLMRIDESSLTVE